jgi:ABC-type phosphate transport system ATPase subunit
MARRNTPDLPPKQQSGLPRPQRNARRVKHTRGRVAVKPNGRYSCSLGYMDFIPGHHWSVTLGTTVGAILTMKMEVKALTLRLGDRETILHQVSLAVPAGQVTSLIGPSGSGKSTLLRCLNRLWEPPAGTVWLEGVDITTLDVLALRRRVGMLFQQAAMFDGSVADNIRYGPALRGEQITPARVEALLKMAGLTPDVAGKPAGELSGGQAQRVALARALANEPDVLLLDEPTSALDPAATRRVEETILSLRDSLGLTVVWVSHAIEQVERTADNLVLLVKGKVVEAGDPAHLLSGVHPHLTDDFAKGELDGETDVRAQGTSHHAP